MPLVTFGKVIVALVPCLASLALCGAELDLSGEWILHGEDRRGNSLEFPAKVPGGVHDALLDARLISDPYWGSNETNALWVARRGWTFSRTFTVDDSFLAHGDIVLRLEDCDTYCSIRINGREAGTTSNRFRRYDLPVKSLLKAGVNTIEGVFRSPVEVADKLREAYGRPYPMGNPIWAHNQALIRKPACHAGWDWGPEIETIGFCGTVKLLAANKPRIDYVHTSQTFTDDLSHCTLLVFADLSDGTTVTNRVEIDNPPLWWPNGAGEQRFYTFTVDVNGEKVTRRIGLRKLEVLNERTVSEDGKDELSLVFRVNNRRLFMKGANWIPCDAIESRQSPERYRDLLQSAASANMNMIRVWGGGQYEKDCFYDMCDELGLLVWHDMMFACAAYPADDAFLCEIEGELSHQLRRLKDHACIALWCGDNECLGAIKWYPEIEDDIDFYRAAWVSRSKMQGEAVAKFDPGRTYWPSSPCCGPGDFGDAWKDDSKGDMHNWDVWHENEPFEKYREYRPRFCSEFGYQSFPSPEVAATFSNGRGDDFEWHQKNEDGNKRIRETMLRLFGRAKDFESELILSQFQQAMAIKTAVDAWRAEMPRCMGTLYWQLNDVWPVASWSSLEYGGKWKPLHYAAKRFFAPVAVVAKPDGSIFGINDTTRPLAGKLIVEHWAYDGRAPMNVEACDVSLAPDAATRIGSFPTCGEEPEEPSFVVFTLATEHGAFANEWHSSPYRDSPLAKAEVLAKIDGFNVMLSAERPAFFVWLDVPGVRGEFSDNCITLLPGRHVTVTFRPKGAHRLTAEEFRTRLNIRSLTDLLTNVGTVPHDIKVMPGAKNNDRISGMALESTIAGTWYPGSERTIRAFAEKCEAAVAHDAATASKVPNILVLPHAGWEYSGEVAWSAARTVRGASFRRVVLLAPSHRAWIENRLVAPESDAVATPLGEIPIDRDWLDRLALIAPVVRNDRVHLAEHSAQIEYPFLQLALGTGFSIVPLIMGSFGGDQMAMCARALGRLMDEETLLVISSDFTHYGNDFSYAPYGAGGGKDVRQRVAAVDEEAFSCMAKCDADGFAALIKRTGATICGHVPIEMALRAFPEGTSLARTRYATSSDGSGDYSRFVCYLAATGCAKWRGECGAILDSEDRAFLLRLARESLTHAVRGERTRGIARELAADAPKATLAKMGAFVTLNDRTTGALRGCIGEILPMRPLVEAVADRAVDSALHDPRFMPVTERELANLRVEVSALTPPKPVASWQDIVLGRDGMTLEKNGHFAVFLPQVAPEQGWDLKTTLSYLSQKAGLSSDAWRDGAKFETFQAEVFHE